MGGMTLSPPSPPRPPSPPAPPARSPRAPARVQLGFSSLLGAQPALRPKLDPHPSTPSTAGPPGAPHAPTAHRPPPKRDEGAADRGPNDDLLDPLYRQGALLVPTSPPVAAPPPAPASPPPSPLATPSLEDLVPQLVRKLALAGDGRRATVRVELGGGPLAGATVVVSNESGAIRVDVEAPSGLGGAERAAWSERIRSRLVARGLAVESVAVG